MESDGGSQKFLEELRGLGSDSLDFRDAVRRKMDLLGTDRVVRDMVVEVIG